MNVNSNLIQAFLIGSIVIIGGSIYFLYDMNRKSEIIEQLDSEFPLIVIDEMIDGTITHIRLPDLLLFRYDSTFARIVLNDSLRRRIKTSYEANQKFPMNRILKVGDRLIKKHSSSKIWVYHVQEIDTFRYSFELVDDLGYPLRKKYR